MGLAIRRTSPFILALCWALLILEGYDVVVFGAAVPALKQVQSWHLSQSDVGLIGSVAVLGMLVGALLAGPLADNRGRRPTLLSSMVIFSLGMLLCALAPSPTVFTTGRFVVGLGTGVLLPSAATMVAEFALPARRNFHQGLTFSGIGFGGALSALVTLAFGPTTFRMAFLVGVVPAVILFPVMLRWLPESVEYLVARGRTDDARRQLARIAVEGEIVAEVPMTRTRRPGSWRFLLSHGLVGRTLLFWATAFMSLLILYGVYTSFPVLMTQAGYNLGSAITFFLVLNLGMVGGALAASRLADWLGRRGVIVTAFCCSAAGFVALAQQPPTAVAYLLVAVVGAGALGTQLLINAFVTESYPTVQRGTAIGATLGVGRLGGALGPIYVSWLLGRHEVQAGFYGFAFPAVLAAIFVLAVPRRPPAPAS